MSTRFLVPGPRQGHSEDLGGAGSKQRAGTGIQGRAARRNVVHDEYVPTGNPPSPCLEGPADIFTPLSN